MDGSSSSSSSSSIVHSLFVRLTSIHLFQSPAPMRLSRSYEFLPPDSHWFHVSLRLRLVLLGNSWSDRSSVGNLILGQTQSNPEEEPDTCQRVRGQVEEKEVVLINTPDLLHPHISQQKLTQHVGNCVRLSDPGPHVFLLVLQPEDFTEEHRLRLCRVLKLFSDRSFDHSMVLISTPREESSGSMEQYRQHPPLKDLIRKCRYRHLELKNLERAELLTRLGQVVKENRGEHSPAPMRPSRSYFLPPNMSELRLVLLGNSWSDRSSVGNLILGQTQSNPEEEPDTCQRVRGQVEEKEVVLINTSNLTPCSVPKYNKY